MTRIAKTRAALRAAMKKRILVRLERRFDRRPFTAVVLTVGPQWFLLAYVSDDIHYNGFEVLRIRDIQRVRPEPYARVFKIALKLRGLKKPRTPRINLNSIEEIVRTLSRISPLLTISQEQQNPDECQIGRVVALQDGKLDLLEIGPAANWAQITTRYALASITRIDFGGGYEEALYLVGGEPPVMKSKRKR